MRACSCQWDRSVFPPPGGLWLAFFTQPAQRRPGEEMVWSAADPSGAEADLAFEEHRGMTREEAENLLSNLE